MSTYFEPGAVDDAHRKAGYHGECGASAENSIRPFTIGRKNWLFANSQAGAQASANLYSLMETAKANDLNPYAFLKYLFTELPNAEDVEAFERLLP